MIAYHGSNRNFKKLRISKQLVQRTSTELNEGIGIYFSTNKRVAESYGNYVYILEINDKYFKDFRKKSTCITHIKKLVSYVYKKTGVNIQNFIELNTTINYMHFGGISIYNLSKELGLLLDSSEEWYRSLSQTKRNQVLSALRQYDKEQSIAYMFNYSIKNIGVIKRISDDIVVIRDKIAVY